MTKKKGYKIQHEGNRFDLIYKDENLVTAVFYVSSGNICDLFLYGRGIPEDKKRNELRREFASRFKERASEVLIKRALKYYKKKGVKKVSIRWINCKSTRVIANLCRTRNGKKPALRPALFFVPPFVNRFRIK